MLSNCSVSVSVAEGRYTWRHDSILYTLLQYLCQLKNYGFNIYGDLEGYCKTIERFHSFRPDIVLVKDDTIYILELTCCFETNTEKSRNFKMNKYIDIKNVCTRRFRHCKKIFSEITSLCLVTTHIENLNSIFKETDINYIVIRGWSRSTWKWLWELHFIFIYVAINAGHVVILLFYL